MAQRQRQMKNRAAGVMLLFGLERMEAGEVAPDVTTRGVEVERLPAPLAARMDAIASQFGVSREVVAAQAFLVGKAAADAENQVLMSALARLDGELRVMEGDRA